ncbi:MAG: hypothetical protein ABH854_00510 [Candidatus Diapherotrites archaeon]
MPKKKPPAGSAFLETSNGGFKFTAHSAHPPEKRRLSLGEAERLKKQPFYIPGMETLAKGQLLVNAFKYYSSQGASEAKAKQLANEFMFNMSGKEGLFGVYYPEPAKKGK